VSHLLVFALLEDLIAFVGWICFLVGCYGVSGAVLNRRAIQRLGVNGLMASIARSNLFVQLAFAAFGMLWAWFGTIALIFPPTAGQLSPSFQVWAFYAVAMATISLITAVSLYLQVVFARRRRVLMPRTEG
jgi:hypothetical protein